MEKKKLFDLPKHSIYYIKNEKINYYISIPNVYNKTNICIEVKNKMSNFDLENNDEIWVLENLKNTYEYIDEYNITLVIPVFNEEQTSILEKIDDSKFEGIDIYFSFIINNAYNILKEDNKIIEQDVILIDNDRYKTFINWFTAKYRTRIKCIKLLDLIKEFNANATSYKKLETPSINFVVGKYNTEVDAPKVIKQEEEPTQKLVPQTSKGFTSYWLLLVITLAVSLIIALIAFNYK